MQHHRNSRDCYLHLEELNNGRRRGSLIVPKGNKGCGIAYHLKKVAEQELVQWKPQGVLRRGDTPGVGLEARTSATYATILAGSSAECTFAMASKGTLPSVYGKHGPYPVVRGGGGILTVVKS